MNKLLITALLVATGFASCYKEKDPPDVKGLLIAHKWYLTGKLEENTDVTTDCALSEELTFNKDSTGYFYNATPCDTTITAPDSTFFNWVLSTNKKDIYFKNLRGVTGTNMTFYISAIDRDNLRIGGTTSQGRVVAYVYAKSE